MDPSHAFVFRLFATAIYRSLILSAGVAKIQDCDVIVDALVLPSMITGS